MQSEWLTLFNLISLLLFVLAVFVGLARMVLRYLELRMAGERIPRLLKRDLLLFSAFALVFGVGGFVSRVLGIPLSQEPAWILPVSLFSLFAIFYWVRVEYTLENESPADSHVEDAAAQGGELEEGV